MTLRNVIKGIAANAVDQQPALVLGTVINVDSKNHRVRVSLPGNVITPWLPVMTAAAGQGWGFVAMPGTGMQVALMGTFGSNSDLLVLGAVHSDVDPPPKVANSIGSGGIASTGQVPPVEGELLAVHKSGSVIRLCDDGSIYVRGNVNIDGVLTVNGNVFDQHGSIDRLRRNYDNHVHGNVQNGSGQTALPNAIDPE